MSNGVKIKDIDAIILCGGKGKRLQSIVNDRPKPMAEVAGRPFLEWIILSLKAQGVQRVIFCTGYMNEAIKVYFNNGNRWGIKILYSHESTPLGTAGAIRCALNQISSDRFLVFNGDSYSQIDIACLEDFHVRHSAYCTIYLTHVDDCSSYGSVAISKDGAIESFYEKPKKKSNGLINAGIYLLEKKIAQDIPEDRAVSIETEFFPRLIGRGLYGVVGKGPFIDIGTVERYAQARQFFISNYHNEPGGLTLDGKTR